MEPKHLQRKLAAILYADVAGYSRLTGEDEEGTHHRLSTYLDLISTSVEQYRGKVMHFAGDAVLADFGTVSDALMCAAAVQRDLGRQNADLPFERKVQFRIGVNLGEVIVDRNEIYGDGVNVAARLESLAEAGGICISESVHAAIGNKLPLDYEFIGEQRVKNIENPVRAYHARLRSGAELPAPPPPVATTPIKRSPAARRTFLISGFVVAIAVIVGVLAWLKPWAPRHEPASVDRMAFPLPEKPSIAVLPFQNLSGDPQQNYFADGMTEDLITDLSKVAGLFVIARNSTFAYKDKSRDIRRVAEELGVRYVLEGSIQRSGDQVRINAQLIDATTGGHIWADRYDGHLNDVFALQDKVTGNIVAVLAVQLTTGDHERAAHKGTSNAQAYDAFLQGWQLYLRQTPEDFRKAITHFQKAVELDPQYARAYAALAATYWEASKRFWGVELGLNIMDEARFEAEQFLAKAMKDPTPLAHQVASAMFLQMQQHEEAVAEAQRAIALDPNDADSYIALAGALSLAGQADEALGWVEHAMRLNPHYPPYYLYQLGLAQFGMQQLDEAAVSLERATILNPDDRWSSRLLLATYGLLGRHEDARKVVEAIKERDKRGRIAYFDPLTVRASAFWLPFKEPRDAQRLAQGLRQAGIPD